MKKQNWQRAALMSQWVGMLFMVGLLLAGCATPTTNTPDGGPFSPLPGDLTNSVTSSDTNTGGSGLAVITEKGDRFAIGDLVTVKFSGTVDQNLETHEERIKEDGTITLHLIGAVKSVGKNSGELQKEIHDRYVPDYYKRLLVTVSGEQRVYSVGGRVRSPGRQSYIGATSVLKAIQSAGDFDDFAAKTRVEVTRADGTFIVVDCVKAAKNPKLDLPIFPGDKINVPLRDWRDILR